MHLVGAVQVQLEEVDTNMRKIRKMNKKYKNKYKPKKRTRNTRKKKY